MPWLWAPSLAEVAVAFVVWRGEIQGDAWEAASQFRAKLFHPVEPQGGRIHVAHRAVNLDFTDTYKKDAKPTRVQSIGAFGWLLSSDVTEVDEKRCPTSAGSQARCASRSPGF